MSWAALARAAGLRKPYVAAYARWLQEGRPPAGESALAAMEAGLEEGAICRFRWVALLLAALALADVE
jgi:hypothetical protein